MQSRDPEQTNSQFSRFLDRTVSRRELIRTSGALGLIGFFGLKPICHASSANNPTLLGFSPVSASSADQIRVPVGYQSKVLISWGDPLFIDSPVFSQKADSKAQLRQFGDNNDGMSLFMLNQDRAVLVVNNEYTNYEYLFDHQGQHICADDIAKSQAAMGVSILEVFQNANGWQVDISGDLNRRITANTPMKISGPAAGHQLMQTSVDPDGYDAKGTFGNCANGQTPWGTYLTCEENVHKMFGSETDVNTGRNSRFGIKSTGSKYQWHKHDDRFDIAKEPNEPNRHGWIVEIDPMDPTSTPIKRTALGRFQHENAAVTLTQENHVVVYMGDDTPGEHIYKFVSSNQYDPDNPLANRKLLDEGTLYVAQFHGEQGEHRGLGRWIELTHGKNGLTAEKGFNDQAEVVIFARHAATQVGATTMDRPEWVAVHPDNRQVFCSLTNNWNRGLKETQKINPANPRPNNQYGHIIRWRPTNDDHRMKTFSWDVYVFAGNPNYLDTSAAPEEMLAGSSNINTENSFSSPDGIGFDPDGRLWIQTDGNYSNKGRFEGIGNNQMLCSDPATGEIRRFLTGPVACEITGLAFSPDQRSLFIGVQHPGAFMAKSHFPDGGDSIPRSSVVVITKSDGGIIGS